MTRYYNRWAGNPHGTPGNPERCAAEVDQDHRGLLTKQCGNKSGHGPEGLFCPRHAALIAEGRAVNVPRERG